MKTLADKIVLTLYAKFFSSSASHIIIITIQPILRVSHRTSDEHSTLY